MRAEFDKRAGRGGFRCCILGYDLIRVDPGVPAQYTLVALRLQADDGERQNGSPVGLVVLALEWRGSKKLDRVSIHRIAAMAQSRLGQQRPAARIALTPFGS